MPTTTIPLILSFKITNEPIATKIGAVLTNKTEFATEVNFNELIQVAKCRHKKSPESKASQISFRVKDAIGLFLLTAAVVKKTAAEMARRYDAMIMAGASQSLIKIDATETAEIPTSSTK
jgi:hypothetical protein